jgi:hypothetical protein
MFAYQEFTLLQEKFHVNPFYGEKLKTTITVVGYI